MNELLLTALEITDPAKRAYAIERITNAHYENLPSLKRDMNTTTNGYKSTRDVDAKTSDAVPEAYDVDAGAIADIEQANEVQEGGANMASQGGNMPWLEAIKIAEINATPEGIERTLRIRDERRVQSSRGNMQARRKEQAGAVQARKTRRAKVMAKKPKYARRAVAVPPSQR